MDTDELKARSIELAERAYRLEKKALNDAAKEAFDKSADDLIQINNSERFYFAQIKLELGNSWTEEMRSLAHEINVSDLQMRNIKTFSFEDALSVLEAWVKSYEISGHADVIEVANNILKALNTIFAESSSADKKDAFNYLLSLTEAMLDHSHSETDDSQPDPKVYLLRKTRDSLLVQRELLADDDELIRESEADYSQASRVNLARNTVQGIYKNIPEPEIKF